MYLKRLEVSAFKSFATRTSFEFDDGITAIVGPNGSGKSNIADALRWVLGEQSGRLLRTRKLEDVIFAGGNGRSRGGKAEVTITLDNSENQLPLDFTEVGISRRAHRSGDSDYRVNQKKVLLRDVQKLLLKANASQSSYSIIGQGLVESVLSLRPEERRQLIEETSDIQGYRLSVEESQRRLLATRENMERVALLVSEIAPRLLALERQSKRAVKHVQLSQELAQALQAWHEHHWGQAVEALSVAKASHDQAQAEEAQACLAGEDCERGLASLGQEIGERLVAIGATAAEREAMLGQVNALEQSITLAGDRRSLLEERQRELEDVIAVLEKEIQSQDAIAQTGEGSPQEALETELASAHIALEEKTSELANLGKEFHGMQGKATGSEERAANLRSAASSLKTRIQRLTHSRLDLDNSAARLNIRRQAIITQMSEQVMVIRGQRVKEAEAAADVSKIATRRQGLEAETDSVKEALDRLGQKQQSRRSKLEGLEVRLEVLTEAQEYYRHQDADQKSEPKIEVAGFLASMHRVLQVPKGMELAIEAALADYVEAVIVERKEEALALAQAIAEEQVRRTYIIAMDSLKLTSPLNILKERGVLGVASRLVKCESRFQQVVNALLGRVIVVQDTTVATHVIRRGMGTVVTLDGIVFHPGGSLSAGFPKVSRPHLLSHERDLTAIPNDTQRVRRSLELTQHEVDNLNTQLAELNSGLSNLGSEVDLAQGRRRSIQNNLNEREGRQAHLRGEMRGLMAALSQVNEQSKAFGHDIEWLEAEQASLNDEAQQGEESAQYLDQAVGLFDERRDALMKETTETSLLVSRLEAELQIFLERRATQTVTMARLKEQVEAKRAQLATLSSELSLINSTTYKEEAELMELRGHYQASSEAHGPEQATIVQMEVNQKDLQATLHTSRERLLQAERRLLKGESAVRRWEIELASLKQRIQEDGLAISDSGQVSIRGVSSRAESSWSTAGSDSQDELRQGQGGGLPPISGGSTIDPAVVGSQIEGLRRQLNHLGPVNSEAEVDCRELKKRHDFLASQLDDLNGAERSLLQAIDELEKVMSQRFRMTFRQVAKSFATYFEAFFGGGKAELSLAGNGSGGVEVMARPPGKRTKGLAQLSGGEKALTALALLFAMLKANASPFCVLDEVDAMLDETNVGRFITALKELAKSTQFIVITHNRRTIEVADTIYGVSMGDDGTSRVLSLRLADVTAH